MAKSRPLGASPPKVGVRIPPWTPYVRGIYPGLLAYMREHGPWQLETSEETTYEIRPSRIDKDWQGDGLIVFRCSVAEAQAWKRRGIRIVNISTEPCGDGDRELPNVSPDNIAAGEMAAEHLLQRGLTRFAYSLDPNRRYSQERLAGFEAAIGKAGYSVDVISIAVSKLPFRQRWRAVEAELRRRLPELKPPVGLFAKDDVSAACIVRNCQLVGLRVPTDIAVMGFNNDPTLVYTTSPSLTSVAYPAESIGWNAASILDQMLRKPDWQPESPILVPVTEIVQRESTAVYSFEDPLVSEVWAMIQHVSADHAIQVRELSDRLAVAGSTLRRRFHRATGRTLKSAIDESRLNLVKQQLTQTGQSIKQIAYTAGFRAPEDLTRFVRRHTGFSPGRWRERAKVQKHLELSSKRG